MVRATQVGTMSQSMSMSLQLDNPTLSARTQAMGLGATVPSDSAFSQATVRYRMNK